MANPTTSSVHVDQTLSTLSTAYFQDPMDFVAPRVAPNVPVTAKTDKYWTFDKNDALRDRALERGPGTESAGGGFRLSTDSYAVKVYAWHVDLDDQTLANADDGLDLESAAARYNVDVLRRAFEYDFLSTAFVTGVWAIDLDGTTNFVKWSSDTSTPIEDVETQRVAIKKATGRTPNTLVLGPTVYSRLKNHPDFIERIRYVSDSVVTSQIMARLFEVDRILVADATNATNLEGETAAYDFMASDNALLAYVAPAPGRMTPSALYTFTWSEVSDGSPAAIGTTRIEIPERRVVRIESQLAWDVKVVGSDMGAFFEDVL
jgi:hypothetical protein